jgi:uncharacterized protein (TIGR02596 family)
MISSYKRRAFSLIELLVVCGIIAIIAAFAIPASVTVMRGSQLTQASQVLQDQMALARQNALTRNRVVEVRFYTYKDPEVPGQGSGSASTGMFRALQLFELLPNGAAIPLGRFQRIPSAVVMNEGALSTILKRSTPRQAEARLGDPELPALPKGEKWNYKIASFRFLPDGSTDLSPTGKWYVTIYGAEHDSKISQLPSGGINFFTLQLDPVSGSTRAYRPNAG